MMFLSMADGLNNAVSQITEAVTGIRNFGSADAEFINGGLGPITMLSDTEQLKANSLSFAVDFGIQICATILLFLAVRFLFWKPITKILEARREVIDKNLDDAKRAKEDALALEEQVKREMTEARQRIKQMLDDAEKEGNIKRDQIISEAKEEARRQLEILDSELQQEKKNMSNQIRQEIVDIAFQAAEKIVAKEIDQEKYLDVVDDILKGVND